MWGMETRGNRYPSTNAFLETAQNCELLINIGDKETTTGIISGYFISDLMFWMDEFVENVYLSPDLNYSGAVHADKWIPVLPCQDTALFMAIAYIWITEDTYDQDYLDTHSIGFDKYKANVMGDTDGIPKTPEWASPLCGVPVYTIKALARNWAQKRTSGPAGGNGGAFIRGPYSTEPARTVVALLAMQGMGKPGQHMFRWSGAPTSANRFSFDKTLVRGEPCPARGLEEWESAYDYFRPHSFIPKTLIHDAILKSPMSWNGGVGSAGMLTEDQWRSFQFPISAAEGGTDLHMLWTDTPCWTACWNGGNRYIEALRDPKIEFVVTEHPWLENDTLLSDIILPTTTKYEEYDMRTSHA
jgi:trimethylamine-N-oxide reductase (cytochrome c)